MVGVGRRPELRRIGTRHDCQPSLQGWQSARAAACRRPRTRRDRDPGASPQVGPGNRKTPGKLQGSETRETRKGRAHGDAVVSPGRLRRPQPTSIPERKKQSPVVLHVSWSFSRHCHSGVAPACRGPAPHPVQATPSTGRPHRLFVTLSVLWLIKKSTPDVHRVNRFWVRFSVSSR